MRLISRKESPRYVLDIGCGGKPFAPLFDGAEYYGTDLDITVRPDAVADNTSLPFADETFDLVIASETLEHTRDYRTAIQEIFRVTKPGGIVFVSMPFAYPVHSAHDYQRLTAAGLKAALEVADQVRIEPSNTVFSSWLVSLEQLITWGLNPLSRRSRVARLLHRGLICLPNAVSWCTEALVSIVLDMLDGATSGDLRVRVRSYLESSPSGYAVIAKKSAHPLDSSV